MYKPTITLKIGIILFGIVCFLVGAAISYEYGIYYEHNRLVNAFSSNYVIQMGQSYYTIQRYDVPDVLYVQNMSTICIDTANATRLTEFEGNKYELHKR